MTDNADTFDTRLQQLKTLVETMEKGDTPLEDALKYYEQGIALIRACETQLKNAEQTILRLQNQNGTETLTPFTDP